MWCSKCQTLPVGDAQLWHLLCNVHFNFSLLHIMLGIYFQCQRVKHPLKLRLCSINDIWMNEWVFRTGGKSEILKEEHFSVPIWMPQIPLDWPETQPKSPQYEANDCLPCFVHVDCILSQFQEYTLCSKLNATLPLCQYINSYFILRYLYFTIHNHLLVLLLSFQNLTEVVEMVVVFWVFTHCSSYEGRTESHEQQFFVK